MSRPTGPLPAVDKQVLKSLEVPPGAIQSQRGDSFLSHTCVRLQVHEARVGS